MNTSQSPDPQPKPQPVEPRKKPWIDPDMEIVQASEAELSSGNTAESFSGVS